MSRVIGFVYRYAFQLTTLLSLLSVAALAAGHIAVGCAETDTHCRVAFGQLAAAHAPAMKTGQPHLAVPVASVAEDAASCGHGPGRTNRFIRA